MKMTSVLERLMLAVSFAQRLRHQPRLQAHLRFAHLAFDFRLRRQRRNRIDHHDVHRTGTHQHVGDLQRLLAVVRLRNQQFGNVAAELLRILRIERVLGVDEGSGAADFLHLGDDRQRQRGLARGFRTIDFDDAPARQAADAKCQVQAQRAGGNHFHILGDVLFAKAHDRALAELFFDLGKGGGKRLAAVFVHSLFLSGQRRIIALKVDKIAA